MGIAEKEEVKQGEQRKKRAIEKLITAVSDYQELYNMVLTTYKDNPTKNRLALPLES